MSQGGAVNREAVISKELTLSTQDTAEHGLTNVIRRSDSFSVRHAHAPQELVLTLFSSGQQLAEFRSFTELYQQWVGLKGSVGTAVLFNGFSQQAQRCVLLPTVGERRADGIQRLNIGSHNGGIL
jgi:hypothetical protein